MKDQLGDRRRGPGGVKPAKLRPLAEQDLIERTRYYVAVEDAVLGSASSPRRSRRSGRWRPCLASGRRWLESSSGVDGLRRIGVTGLPTGRFYIERAEHLDVIRLLADTQDLEDLLGET